jgi:hypothetical protein
LLVSQHGRTELTCTEVHHLDPALFEAFETYIEERGVSEPLCKPFLTVCRAVFLTTHSDFYLPILRVQGATRKSASYQTYSPPHTAAGLHLVARAGQGLCGEVENGVLQHLYIISFNDTLFILLDPQEAARSVRTSKQDTSITMTRRKHLRSYRAFPGTNHRGSVSAGLTCRVSGYSHPEALIQLENCGRPTDAKSRLPNRESALNGLSGRSPSWNRFEDALVRICLISDRI